MICPRKRTYLPAVLLLAALLVGGTASSSRLARRRSSAGGKNHSATSVSRTTQSKSKRNGSASSAARRPHAAKLANEAMMAEFEYQRSQAEQAGLREALARRQGGKGAGRLPTLPAQVQDPPAMRFREPQPVTTAKVRPIENRRAAHHTARPRVLPRVAMGEAPVRMADNDDLIREALRNRGTPYVWGGASRGGFDCSGFVCYIFKKMRGLKLPHSASAQARLGAPVTRDELLPGDLVFFATYRPSISHVGIYIGENRFIHAANRRSDTKIDSLSGYYDRRYRVARRLTPTPIRFSEKDLEELMRDSSELPSDGTP